MRKYLICCLVVLAFDVSYGQKLIFNIGNDLGFTLTSGTSNQKARIGIFLNSYYKIGKSLSVGLEASTSGGFIYILGGGGSENNFDTTQNKTILYPGNMHANTFLLRGRHTFNKYKVKPYFDLGLGINTYYYNYPITSVEQIARNNFSFSPEIGITIHHFQLAINYLYGGYTPNFIGTDDRGAVVELKSEKISSLYIRLAYQFQFPKHKH